jgi:hypothetical protein
MVAVDIHQEHQSPSSMSTAARTGSSSTSPQRSLLKPQYSNKDGCESLIDSDLTRRPPRSGVQQKRRVRFHKTIYNRRIPHLNDMSERLREDIWIQPEEYLEIRKACIATVKKMMKSELTEEDVESEEHCPRGLEGKTREGAGKRKEYKLDSLAAVLDEQSLQWNDDVEDDEAIMECYIVFSFPCAEAAHITGLEDEAAVQEYLQEEEPYYDSSCNRNNQGWCDDECYSNRSTAMPSMALPALVEKLTNVVLTQSRRATLLQEIEQNFYEESSIQRRRQMQEEQYSYRAMANNSLAEQIRLYFAERKNSGEQRRPCDGHSGDGENERAPPLTWDEDSSSSMSENSNETFTSELSDMFHSRKRRQSLLDEIERSFFVEPTVVSENASNLTILTQKLSSNLNPIVWVRKTRQSMLQELATSNE